MERSLAVTVETIPVGLLETNCYLVLAGNSLVIIDPGSDPEVILQACGSRRVSHVLLTHGHFDHVTAVDAIRKKKKCPVILHKKDICLYDNARETAAMFGCSSDILDPPDVVWDREEDLALPEPFRVMHTPGHSPGGVCYIAYNYLFSGDTLFAGSIGRTDLQGSSTRDMEASLKKILLLPDDLKVCPGHGPSTTLRKEKETNPFLLDLE
jgi:hydroxyacylglutathione hydrolase